MKKQSWITEFEEAYNSFELCDEVSIKDYKRLKQFISKTVEQARREAIKALIPDGATNATVMYKKDDKVHSFALQDLLDQLKKANNKI